MQTNKDTFVIIRKIYEKFDSTTWLLLQKFIQAQVVIGLVTSSMLQNE